MTSREESNYKKWVKEAGLKESFPPTLSELQNKLLNQNIETDSLDKFLYCVTDKILEVLNSTVHRFVLDENQSECPITGMEASIINVYKDGIIQKAVKRCMKHRSELNLYLDIAKEEEDPKIVASSIKKAYEFIDKELRPAIIYADRKLVKFWNEEHGEKTPDYIV